MLSQQNLTALEEKLILQLAGNQLSNLSWFMKGLY